MTNDWYGRRETSTFLENVCSRGPFKKDYTAARDAAGTGAEVTAKVTKAILGPRDSLRVASQTITFFIPFTEAVQCNGVTEKLYK